MLMDSKWIECAREEENAGIKMNIIELGIDL